MDNCYAAQVMKITELENNTKLLQLRFYVDPSCESGLRIKTVIPRSKGKPHDVAGRRSERDYWLVKLEGVYLRASRVIWILLHDEIPSGLIIDHRDSNPLNNHPSNLQLLTRAQNTRATSKKSSRNTSGFLGVFRRKDRNNAWLALMRRNGKLHYLGSFSSPIAAARRYNEAVIAWAKEYGEEPRYLNPV